MTQYLFSKDDNFWNQNTTEVLEVSKESLFYALSIHV